MSFDTPLAAPSQMMVFLPRLLDHLIDLHGEVTQQFAGVGQPLVLSERGGLRSGATLPTPDTSSKPMWKYGDDWNTSHISPMIVSSAS